MALVVAVRVSTDHGGRCPVTEAEIAQADAAFFERIAAEEIRAGRIEDGLYFLDAADTYAEPSPQMAAARIVLLQDAMSQLDERTAGR
jgi:hypothetical protein